MRESRFPRRARGWARPSLWWGLAAVLALAVAGALLLAARLDGGPPEMSYTFSYDPLGRLSGWVDAEGRHVSYSYSDENRLTSVRYPDREVSFEYDANGNLAHLVDESGGVSYSYDPFGRLTRAAYSYSPGRGLAYEYDPWGRLSRVTVTADNGTTRETRYDYDLFGRLLAVEDEAGRSEYSYQPESGKILRRLPNGITSAFEFTAGQQLKALRHRRASGGLIADYEYDYDKAGRVTTVRERTPEGERTSLYAWDARGALASAVGPDGTKTVFEYDSAGNRVTKTDGATPLRYGYDSFGRLTQAGDTSYTYDRSGDLTAVSGPDRSAEFRWDAECRLIGASLPDGEIRYEYDGLGHLVSRTEDDRVVHFLPDPLAPIGTPLAEFDDEGTLVASYLYGDGLLGRRDGEGRTLYFLEDGFSLIRQVASENGEIVGGRDYSPFAEVTNSWGAETGGLLRAGQREDPDLGYLLVGAEVYDPETGRRASPATPPTQPGAPAEYNLYMPIGGTDERPLGLRIGVNEGALVARSRALQYAIASDIVSQVAQGVWGNAVGAGVSTVLGFADPVSNQLSRVAFGGPVLAWEDSERYGRAGLSALGGAISTNLVGTPLPGTIASMVMADASAGLGRFYGTRMDRPYWWWSPMKWVPEDLYHARRLQQAQYQIARAYDAQVRRQQSATESAEEANRKLTEAARKFRRRRVEPPMSDDRGDNFPPWFPPPPPLPVPVGEQTAVPRRWDGSDDGSPWAADLGKRGPLVSPFHSPAPGGIDLNVTARLLGDLSGISGAVYDRETDRLVLVGEGYVSLPAIRLDDLAVALKCLSSGQAPFFSLDPADPRHPEGPWLRCVYHGSIEDTAFGAAMFEADWWLKAYSFGRNRDGFQLLSRVPDYKSIFDLSFEQPDAQKGSQWIRYWITCDSAVLGKHGNALRFDEIRMKVNTENMWRARTGLKPVEGERDPLAERFAQHFTEHYDEFARETPALFRVKQLACAVALADWMLSSGIPIDPELVERWASPAFPTPTHVPALSASESQETRTPIPGGVRIETFSMYLFGGVDLSMTEPQLSYVPNAPGAEEIDVAVRQAMVTAEAPKMAVPLAGNEATGIVLPLTRGGRRAWESGELVDTDGSVYTLDSDLHVSKVRRPDGTTADVGYASDGTVADLSYSSPSGWRATGSASAEGARLRVSSPAEDVFDYEWDASGEFKRLLVDGETFVTREAAPAGGSETFSYPTHVETLGRDSAGRLTSRTVVPAEGSAGTRGQVSFQYDQSGRLTRVASTSSESIALSYQGGRLTEVSSGGREATCQYDAHGRLVEITSGEATVQHQRSGEQSSEVKWQLGSTSGEISLEEGRVAGVTDGLGNTTRYEYGEGGLLKRVVDPGGHSANFKYSTEGGITGVDLPGGRSLEFNYSPLEGMGSNATGMTQRLESIIIHPVEGEPFGRVPNGTALASAGSHEERGSLSRPTRGPYRPRRRG